MTSRERDESGATAVEFALVVPLLLTFLGGLMALALHVAYAGVAEHTVREGLREATTKTSLGYGQQSDVVEEINSSVPGFLPDAQEVRCFAGTIAPGADVPSGSVCPELRLTRQGEEVTVQVTYELPGVTGLLGLVPLVGDDLAELSTVTREARGRRE